MGKLLITAGLALLAASLLNVFVVLQIARQLTTDAIPLDPIIARSLEDYRPQDVDTAMRDTLRVLWRTRHRLAVCEVSR